MLKYIGHVKKIGRCIAVLMVVICFTAVATAQEPFILSPEDAMSEVMRVLQDITNGTGEYANLTTEADKQAAALNFIQTFRYGADGEKYFWINDLEGKMVMHPIYDELNGETVTGLVDKTGKNLFAEFISVALEKGSGSVDYFWPRPGEEEEVLNTAFVQELAQWGWVLGTGLPLVTIEAYDIPIEPGFYSPIIDDRGPASPV